MMIINNSSDNNTKLLLQSAFQNNSSLSGILGLSTSICNGIDDDERDSCIFNNVAAIENISNVDTLDQYSDMLSSDCESINTEYLPIIDSDTHHKMPNYSESLDNLQITPSIQPFEVKLNSAFHLFEPSKLEQYTDFTHILPNRSASYYGEYPYTYGSITHKARPISDNIYLYKIANYLTVVLPEFNFNSGMVHKYENGDQFIPFHSDDEPDIMEDSLIVMVSLGATRFMCIQNKANDDVTNVELQHGDVLVMTKLSQDYYRHSIPQEFCDYARISVTFRFIKAKPYTTMKDRSVSDSIQTNDSIVQALINLDDDISNNTALVRPIPSASGHVPFLNAPLMHLIVTTKNLLI